MKIAIVGGGFANKGAEAMLRTVQAEVSRRIPEADFVMWGCPPGESRRAAASGFIPVPLDVPQGALGKAVLLAGGLIQEPGLPFIGGATSSARRLWLRALGSGISSVGSDLDGVIDISGFAYGDPWGTTHIDYVAPLMRRASRHGAPILYAPQSWGPFSHPGVRSTAKRLLEYPGSRICARDGVSQEHLSLLLGVEREAIPRTPDIAFLFEGGNRELGMRLIREMGLDCSRPLIGLAPNTRMLSTSHGGSSCPSYVETLADIVRYCIECLGVDVVLQANEIREDGSRDDDRTICSRIWAQVGMPSRCGMTRQYLDAESSRAIIGCLDFLVASRFHSLVFGLSQGIPCMALGWSHKYQELLADVGVGAMAVDYSTLAPSEVLEAVSECWSSRRQSAHSIKASQPSLRLAVEQFFDGACSMLNRYES